MGKNAHGPLSRAAGSGGYSGSCASESPDPLWQEEDMVLWHHRWKEESSSALPLVCSSFSGEGFVRGGMIGCCCNRRRIKSHLDPYTVCCVSYHFRTCKNRFASDPDSTLSGLVSRSNHICRYCTGFGDTLSTGSLACRVLQYYAPKGIHSSCVWWVMA